jgi:hypothetical protein
MRLGAGSLCSAQRYSGRSISPLLIYRIRETSVFSELGTVNRKRNLDTGH